MTAPPTTQRHCAREAGACVIRHPYNKGNGAAVKSGIRQASGEFVLIIDADGQHPPEDAQRIVARLGEHDLVIGARAATTQATTARRAGNARAEWACELPDQPADPGSDRRASGARARSASANSSTCSRTASRRQRRRRWRSSRRATTSRSSRSTRVSAAGRSKIRFAHDGARFLLILLKIVTLFSPLRIFLPVSAFSFSAGAIYGFWNIATTGKIPNGAVVLILFAVIVFLVGLRLRTDHVAAIRRPHEIARCGRWSSSRPTTSATTFRLCSSSS